MRIVYLCPDINTPAGGIKVIYKNAETLAQNGFDAKIIHPTNTNFSCDWFPHNAPIEKVATGITSNDFVVIPEAWAANITKYFVQENIRYTIYVQNGYYINAPFKGDIEEAQFAYYNAEFILSISLDTSKVIRQLFPKLGAEKIIRLIPPISSDSFFSSKNKTKTISYMPRKLPEHAAFIDFYLKQNLPSDWSILSIHNVSEQKTAEILSKSKIFLSFCNREGCPLPPLEAAFSGNFVVGYTGEGAKEYFKKPIFHEIEQGNMIKYSKTVLDLVKSIDNDKISIDDYSEDISIIKNKYSEDSCIENLLEFANRAINQKSAVVA